MIKMHENNFKTHLLTCYEKMDTIKAMIKAQKNQWRFVREHKRKDIAERGLCDLHSMIPYEYKISSCFHHFLYNCPELQESIEEYVNEMTIDCDYMDVNLIYWWDTNSLIYFKTWKAYCNHSIRMKVLYATKKELATQIAADKERKLNKK